MKRQDALQAIVYAGYHGDKSGGTRLMLENRISLSVYNDYFSQGRTARERGVRCNCSECSVGRHLADGGEDVSGQ